MSKAKRNKKQTGFTLIELLVVISIIGLLASLVLVAANKARSKGRDAKRIADLNQVAKAIELFNQQQGQYPVPCSGAGQPTWNQNWQCLASCLESGTNCGFAPVNFTPVLTKTPQDPLNNPADNTSRTYYPGWAAASCEAQNYKLGAFLENNDPALQNDLDGSIFNNNAYCDDSLYGYCVGAGTCSNW